MMKKERSLFSVTFFFLIFYAFSYLIFPTIKILDVQWISKIDIYNEEVALICILWSLVGIAFFLLGYLSSIVFPLGQIVSNGLQKVVIKTDKLYKMWFVSLGLTCVLLMYIFSEYTLMQLVFERTVALRGQGITLFLFSTLVIFSNIIVLVVYIRYRMKWVLVIQFLFLLFVGFGSRGTLLLFILSLFLVPFQKPQSILKSILKISIGSILIGVLMVGIVVVRTPNLDSVSGHFLKRSISNTFQEGEMFTSVYNHYMGRLLYGQTIWDIRYIFYPRQIFPDKPYVWGKAIFERDLGFRGDGAEGLYSVSYAFGQLSELYANFGSFGIIAGMFFWGFIFGSFEIIRRRCSTYSLGYFIYILFFYSLLWIFRHGLLGFVQMSVFPIMIIPAIVIFYFRGVRLIKYRNCY